MQNWSVQKKRHKKRLRFPWLHQQLNSEEQQNRMSWSWSQMSYAQGVMLGCRHIEWWPDIHNLCVTLPARRMLAWPSEILVHVWIVALCTASRWMNTSLHNIIRHYVWGHRLQVACWQVPVICYSKYVKQVWLRGMYSQKMYPGFFKNSTLLLSVCKHPALLTYRLLSSNYEIQVATFLK